MTLKQYCFFISIVTACLISSKVFAQEEKPGVKVIARATERSIKLRWAPNSPTVWKLAIKYGYTLERIAVSENGKVLSEKVRKVVGPSIIKPAAQSLWESAMDADDNVAVAAQAIFGEEFQIVENQSEIMKVVNKAKELESRFSFALFAADQSVKAAELSGLYFQDETIAPKTKYLYRVYANIPAEIHKSDTGFVFIGLDDYKPLPKPLDLKADFKDRFVLLSWNGAIVEKIYNSFWVERSSDGAKTFQRISNQPIINSYAGERPRSKLIFRTDSIPSNDLIYHYRVIGINAFGETGPPSDTVSGAGKPMFGYAASIIQHIISDDGKVALDFTFPPEGENLVRSFDLTRVDPKTKTTTVIKQGVEKQNRSIVDEAPRSSNYYVIRSVDRYGRTNNSFPYLVQLEDSIPPSPPIELTGRIDTAGYVYLNWKDNYEEDLLGYTVYRTNFQSEEFIQIKGPIRRENSYVDTIALNNLTEKIYYKVSAVDKRFNTSKFSVPLVLDKPDKVPPVPPVFASIKSDSIGILLEWIRSGSEDVAQHILYRKAENETDWTLSKVFSLTDTTKIYVDTDVAHRVMYAYTILAVDDDGLESIPSQPLTIRWIADNPYPEVDALFYKIDKTKRNITLSWNYDQADVDKYMIYKSKNGEPMRLYKTIDGNKKELMDQYSVSDTNVEYRVVAGFKSGERTKSSKAIIVRM